jgi:hypothetical protein
VQGAGRVQGADLRCGIIVAQEVHAVEDGRQRRLVCILQQVDQRSAGEAWAQTRGVNNNNNSSSSSSSCEALHGVRRVWTLPLLHEHNVIARYREEELVAPRSAHRAAAVQSIKGPR